MSIDLSQTNLAKETAQQMNDLRDMLIAQQRKVVCVFHLDASGNVALSAVEGCTAEHVIDMCDRVSASYKKKIRLNG